MRPFPNLSFNIAYVADLQNCYAAHSESFFNTLRSYVAEKSIRSTFHVECFFVEGVALNVINVLNSSILNAKKSQNASNRYQKSQMQSQKFLTKNILLLILCLSKHFKDAEFLSNTCFIFLNSISFIEWSVAA